MSVNFTRIKFPTYRKTSLQRLLRNIFIKIKRFNHNIEKVKAIVPENCRVIIAVIAKDFSKFFGSTQHILVNVLFIILVNAKLAA